jgi:hypothetical protein
LKTSRSNICKILLTRTGRFPVTDGRRRRPLSSTFSFGQAGHALRLQRASASATRAIASPSHQHGGSARLPSPPAVAGSSPPAQQRAPEGVRPLQAYSCRSCAAAGTRRHRHPGSGRRRHTPHRRLIAGKDFQYILRLLNTNVDGKQKIMFASPPSRVSAAASPTSSPRRPTST